MKTSTLISELPDDMRTAVLDFESEGRRSVGKITYLSGSDPTDTIIEASDILTVTSHALRQSLGEMEPDGDAQLYVANGDMFAYYDVRAVRRSANLVHVVAGSFRTGGDCRDRPGRDPASRPGHPARNFAKGVAHDSQPGV